MRYANPRAVWAWSFYDWANSAYSTTVMAGFFPVFFKEYWSAGVPATVSTFHLGLANSLSSTTIVLVAALLGAIADGGRARKRFLSGFALLGIAMTAGFYFVGRGEWQAAMAVYVLATIGFGGSLIFYDSLILAVAREAELDRVSALGFAVGYLGGGGLFALNVAMTLKPALFGLASAAEAVRLSFVSVALWWGLFSIPLLLWVREPPGGERTGVAAVRAGLRQLRRTFLEVRRLRQVFLFLLAYWCYIDGVGTIIRMAVDYGLALGFPTSTLIVALLITQFVGFPAAVLFGRLGTWLGPKVGIYIAIVVYTVVVLFATGMTHAREFYLLAAVIGLVQGGIQSLSRSLYARLVPVRKTAEFFGFFNMLGKFAAVLGPLMVGWSSLVTGNSRLSLLSLLLLFGAGALFLARVDVAAGQRAAQEL